MTVGPSEALDLPAQRHLFAFLEAAVGPRVHQQLAPDADGKLRDDRRDLRLGVALDVARDCERGGAASLIQGFRQAKVVEIVDVDVAVGKRDEDSGFFDACQELYFATGKRFYRAKQREGHVGRVGRVDAVHP